MTKDEQGAFCKVCSTHVHDLTNHTSEQVLSFLETKKGEHICIRVDEEMLNKPLLPQAKPSERKRSKLVAFACAVYLVFGSFLFASGQPVTKDTVKIVWPAPSCPDTTIARKDLNGINANIPAGQNDTPVTDTTAVAPDKPHKRHHFLGRRHVMGKYVMGCPRF